jgi:hypothetical protein
MRLFHGRQGTDSALAGRIPGMDDPANPAKRAKAPATQGAEALQQGFSRVTPVEAAATMHNDLSDNAKQLADGSKNVPIHPAQLPTEGTDTNETEGDGSVRDPSGIGFGT